MLALTLATALLMQSPDEGWREFGGDVNRPHAVVVTSDIELSAGEANGSALAEARSGFRQSLRRRADAVVTEASPFWVPGFVRDRVVADWVRAHDAERDLQVLDRRTDVREYSYGKSYQTTLLVEPSPRVLKSAKQQLRLRTKRAANQFLAKCGGISVYWGLLALVCFWLDRLTRGYMTWRLRVLSAGLAFPVAGIVFLM